MNTLAGYIFDHWEDYRAGMYRTGNVAEIRVELARGLLADPDAFGEAAREMIREWPNAARHNLYSMWTGRNAWVGQATCCYSLGASSEETRIAWGRLSNDAHSRANAVARCVRDAWERGWRDAQAVLDL